MIEGMYASDDAFTIPRHLDRLASCADLFQPVLAGGQTLPPLR